MACDFSNRLAVLAASVAMVGAGLALAQTAPAPKPAKNCDWKAPTDQSCAQAQPTAPPPPVQPAPSAASQFPFPGDAAKPNSTQPEAPQAPADQPATPAAKKFPYPGDAAPAGGTADPNASSSSSSSSSSDPGDGADGSVPGADASKAADHPPGRRRLPKVQNLQNDDDREAEDVKVAQFYHDSGNQLAAYNRLHDATKLIHDDADAWYLLGQVAQSMHKGDEALVAFHRFLELEPDTRRAKELEKTQPELKATR